MWSVLIQVWVDRTKENMKASRRSSVYWSFEGNKTPPSSPSEYITKTLGAPEKPKKFKHPALHDPKGSWKSLSAFASDRTING